MNLFHTALFCKSHLWCSYAFDNHLYHFWHLILYFDGGLNTEHLVYITHIFQDNSDSRFCLWKVHKYTEVTELIKKLCACDMVVIPTEELTNKYYLLQEAIREYHNLFDSKQWRTATKKERSQDQPSLPKYYTVSIEKLATRL